MQPGSHQVSYATPLAWLVHSAAFLSRGVSGTDSDSSVGRQMGSEGDRKRAHLVYEVDTGLGGEVAQQVQRPVQMEHDADLAPHAVVEPPGTVVVHEGVAHPKACCRISLDTMLHAVVCNLRAFTPAAVGAQPPKSCL